jgi:protein tyrosine phosphatase
MGLKSLSQLDEENNLDHLPESIHDRSFEKKDGSDKKEDQPIDEKSHEESRTIMDEETRFSKSYINANFINGQVRDFSEKAFIASQGPIPNYEYKFWQMVWEMKSKLIVMLCPTINKNNMEECMNYWNVD